MSRNGAGVYSLPGGSTATTGNTIDASTHNTPLTDLAADMNIARPIVAGGTGEVTLAAAANAFAAYSGTATGDWTASGAWTVSGEWTFAADATLGDSVHLLFGAADDLDIYHNGTATNIIQSNAHSLQMRTDASLTVSNAAASETMAAFTADGSVDLYYDNTKTFETTALGATVTGGITADSFTPTAQTALATTSGSTAAFTGIPATATKVELMFSGVSLSGTDDLALTLGDSGGLESTGYASVAGSLSTDDASTAYFRLCQGQIAGSTVSGIVTLLNIDGDTWVSSGVLASNAKTYWSAGTKTLTGALTQVSLRATGSDTFDAGTFNIRYS